MPESIELSWGKTPRDLQERWPKAPDGTPEKAAFLTSCMEADSQADMLIEMLRAYDIPVIRQYGGDGAFGKIVLGLSGCSVDLYVPEPLLEDAQNLMKPVEEEGENV